MAKVQKPSNPNSYRAKSIRMELQWGLRGGVRSPYRNLFRTVERKIPLDKWEDYIKNMWIWIGFMCHEANSYEHCKEEIFRIHKSENYFHQVEEH
jgi:hypothetical protein